MIRMLKFLVVSLVFGISMNTNSFAQSGAAEAGKQKSTTCVACHGTDGNSPIAQFPKIAGQVPGYIASQLASFKSGARSDPVMAGMVIALSEQDMADLDAYYSSQSSTGESISADQEERARAGELVYRGGVAEFNVPACMGCHGPSGSGIPPAFPRLAGQHAAYIEKQLLALKQGARKNDIMNPIAFPLSEQQISDLALYISALK
jgi:cytochrome c553